MITIQLSRSLLFDIVMNTINHNINSLITETSSHENISMSYEDECWFAKALLVAENKISLSIAHLLVRGVPVNNTAYISYCLQPTHPLQELYLADDIEQGLVVLVCKQWYELKNLKIDVKEREILEKLKSLALMIEPRVRRKYSII